ncbi:MAG: hypothetical protein JNL10_00410 [Verrucomicrobiales bacterium]|nr:hypothetical protein [Verrucomicrobiales bacterium]
MKNGSFSAAGIRWSLVGALGVLLVWGLLPSRREGGSPWTPAEEDLPVEAAARDPRPRMDVRHPPAGRMPTAAEQVAERLDRFVRGRWEVVQRLATSAGVPVPPEVVRFYELAEAGRWDEVDFLYAALVERREGEGDASGLTRFMPALLETLGVHEAVRDWPAQALLDYGKAVLDSVPPGGVYLGGSDSGRFIPTLLADAGEGNGPIVLTQSALAALNYVDYARALYGDRLNLPTPEDSRQAFDDYLADAGRRLRHDRDHPEEPRQVLPGEDIRLTEGGVQVSGAKAVMSINERLARMLLEANPGITLSMEETYPFDSLHDSATPRGPLLEVSAKGEGTAPMTPEQAVDSVSYWQDLSRQLMSDSEVSGSPSARDAYATLLLAQGGLLEQNQFSTEAESVFRLAREMAPENVSMALQYSRWLVNHGRTAEAIPIVEETVRYHPSDHPQLQTLLEQLRGAPTP